MVAGVSFLSSQSLFIRPPLAGLRKCRVNHFRQIAHRQKSITDTSGHCRRHAKRLMDADPIVPKEVQPRRVAMVFKFLAEGIR
jgi:hypothetical protein